MDNKSVFTETVLNYLKINHSSSYSGHFYNIASHYRKNKDNPCVKSYEAVWGCFALAFVYDSLLKK